MTINLKLSDNANATRKLEGDIERLKRNQKVTEITFGTVCAALLFIAVVICPVMIKM